MTAARCCFSTALFVDGLRRARRTRRKRAGFSRSLRSSTEAPALPRRGLAGSVCRPSATGCCASTPISFSSHEARAPAPPRAPAAAGFSECSPCQLHQGDAAVRANSGIHSTTFPFEQLHPGTRSVDALQSRSVRVPAAVVEQRDHPRICLAAFKIATGCRSP